MAMINGHNISKSVNGWLVDDTGAYLARDGLTLVNSSGATLAVLTEAEVTKLRDDDEMEREARRSPVSRATKKRTYDLVQNEGGDGYNPYADGMDLPKLRGSPKQIAWARKIRATAIKLLDADAKTAKLIELAETHTKATWWIDKRFVLEHRNNVVRELLLAAGFIVDRNDFTPTEAGLVWAAKAKI
jgi:hypothetical protein